MWGDPERAFLLDTSDSLSMLLFQVASPAHIPYNDPRWQELLHGYDVWVHVEAHDDDYGGESDTNNEVSSSPSPSSPAEGGGGNGGVLQQACSSMSKHAANSSNLAALALLVSELLEELNPSRNANATTRAPDQVAQFSERIAVVGKARAAAGALQLLRIFSHRVLVDYGNQPSVLADIFTYRNRDDSSKDNAHVGLELLHSLFQFITAEGTPSLIAGVPEVYDTAVLSIQLLLVLLSTQLYQPMVSSFEQSQQVLQQQQQQSPSESENQIQSDFFLDIIIEQTRQSQQAANATTANNQHNSNSNRNGSLNHNGNGRNNNNNNNNKYSNSLAWSPKTILSSCFNFQIQRMIAPERSIARYHFKLSQSVVAAKGERLGPDGMYESNLVVSAAAPAKKNTSSNNNDRGGDSNTHSNGGSSVLSSSSSHHHPSFLLDVIMLPFRLVRLALGLWGNKQNGFDKSQKKHFNNLRKTSRTRDVLWVTESPMADLATALLLVLTNNRRVSNTNGSVGVGGQGQQQVYLPTLTSSTSDDDEDDNKPPEGNPFQIELAALADNRWEISGHDSSALPDLPDLSRPGGLNESISLLGAFDRDNNNDQEPLPGAMSPIASNSNNNKQGGLKLNFETLFLSYGNILHTEVGALSLYTLLQSSKTFSETIAVRSDLDTLVMPLLRTFYFASSARHVSAIDFPSKSSAGEKANGLNSISIRTCPFRSQSQLYLVVILLLLFSQDSSFGSDAFRRTMVATVPWYKERYLKDISLGSVMLLHLLRLLTYNLNRLHDTFLLSNCCAVLMNLSHSVVDLHEYAAMRLASVTVSCLKKYVAMTLEQSKNGGEEENPLLEMYSEISHGLLRLIKHALVQKTIERNLHLVYALVYHQADFKKIFAMKHAPFKKSEINRIHSVIKASAKIIESQQGNARTATKALQALTENIDQIEEAVADKKKKESNKEDFRFTYEEEADPENFFVPYIWEVIVCAVTASSVEWDRDKIQVFPLLEVEDIPADVVEAAVEETGAAPAFANDVMDVV